MDVQKILGFLNKNSVRFSIFFLLVSLSFLASTHIIYPALPSISSPKDIKGCIIFLVCQSTIGQ